jgi:hypothetical protein
MDLVLGGDRFLMDFLMLHDGLVIISISPCTKRVVLR